MRILSKFLSAVGIPTGYVLTAQANGQVAWSAPTSGGALKQVEIDFGAIPVEEGSFVITDSSVTSSSKIVGAVAYEAPTGKDLDEMEMDGLDLKFAPGSGHFTLYARGLDGYVADKFKINYWVG